MREQRIPLFFFAQRNCTLLNNCKRKFLSIVRCRKRHAASAENPRFFRQRASVAPRKTVRPAAGSKNFPAAAFTVIDGEYWRLKRFCTPATSESGVPEILSDPTRRCITS